VYNFSSSWSKLSEENGQILQFLQLGYTIRKLPIRGVDDSELPIRGVDADVSDLISNVGLRLWLLNSIHILADLSILCSINIFAGI